MSINELKPEVLGDMVVFADDRKGKYMSHEAHISKRSKSGSALGYAELDAVGYGASKDEALADLKLVINILMSSTPWQPIASAPKQGRILVFNPMVGVYSSEFVQERRYEPGKKDSELEIIFEGYPLGLWGGKLGKWYCEPTHWMPLPLPPIT